MRYRHARLDCPLGQLAGMSLANKIFEQVGQIGEICPRHLLPHSHSPVHLVFKMSNATAAVTKNLAILAQRAQSERVFGAAQGIGLKDSATGTTWESAQ
jgi:hypothetical protein